MKVDFVLERFGMKQGLFLSHAVGRTRSLHLDQFTRKKLAIKSET
jgi:hypothetical protein